MRHVDLVRLGVFFEGWNIEDHAGPIRARMRFHEVLRYRGVKPASTVTLREMPIGAVATAAPLLRAGLRAWSESGGALDRLSERDRALNVHAALMGRQAQSDDLAFIHLGAKSGIRQALGRDWASKAEGRPSRDAVALPAYRDRVLRAYEHVLARNQPHFDHIRALLYPPGGEPIWVAYQRLLTPYRSRSRGHVVMCLSAITQNIAIPFMSADRDS